ncbi:lipopolysaccharide biosynthesis protein [uncultured Aliiroseovarius sp.]|uniref:lipopolysaccharide biosynthesis protein n=1 Tax=uncultured Aliiroseovarius sp. TaxID=1658783 RepID=UPI002634BBFF|nr:lipopolysaccharide biosynthesis protein [uncultured Aliiroseovarius sp.]
MIRTKLAKLKGDQVAARLLRNLKWIVSSQVAMAILGMVSLAVAARALGAAGLGALALIEAFARIIARLVHLEPWQAVIHHGSAALENKDQGRFARLIGLSVLLDIAGGVLAAVVVLALAPMLAPVMGLEGQPATYLTLGALAVLVSLRATGIALLRLYDRFDVLAKIDTATAAFRAILSVIAYLLGGDLLHFVAIFIAFSLVEGLAAYLFGRREMKRHGQTMTLSGMQAMLTANPGFLRLMWNSNLAVILRQTTQRLDVVILATLVAPVYVGHYHIARRCGEAAIRLGRPIKQVVFPEFARFAARGEYQKISKTATSISLGFTAVLVAGLLPTLWFIEPLVTSIFGPDFAAATTVVSVQAIAVALFLAGVILGPVLLSLDADRGLMWTGVVTAALFFVLLYPLVSMFGVTGAALTHLICNSLWLIACIWLTHRALRAKATRPAANASEQEEPV